MSVRAHEQPPLDLSVIMPVHNQRAHTLARVDAIAAALHGRRFELIVVDDGSIDGTFAALAAHVAGAPWLAVVALRRSFGVSAALAAGFDRARGAVIVTIDGAGQTVPGDIPRLLAAVEAGADVVSGRRDIPRALPTKIGNWLISRVTRVTLHDYGCPLKAYRAEVIERMQLYGDLYRLAPAIAYRHGAQVTEVQVREQQVPTIGPGVGLRRVLSILLDLVTARFLLGYLGRPMQLFGRFGLVAAASGLLIGLVLTLLKYGTGIDIGQRSSLWLAMLLLFIGAQSLALGLLAELLTRIYYEAGRRQIYAVRDELNANVPDVVLSGDA